MAKHLWGVSKPIPAERFGINFPSNGEDPAYFQFTGAAINAFYPATYLWQLKPVQQAGHYTTFFWGWSGNDFTGYGYYGAHPFIKSGPSDTNHQWEISVSGQDPPWPDDPPLDDNGHDMTITQYDRVYRQALVVRAVGGEMELKFYYDLDAGTSYVFTYTTTSGYIGLGPASTPALTFGTAPWAPTAEELSGGLRALQIYATNHSQSDVVAASACESDAEAIALGLASLHYLNMDPTPDDISDKSGHGHHPSWVDSNHGTLWEA